MVFFSLILPKMRLRRLSALFWGMCIVACLFILYVVMDLGFNLPSIKPAIQDLDESKWESFKSKLNKIEKDITKHHAVVGEIKTAMDQIELAHDVNVPDYFKMDSDAIKDGEVKERVPLDSNELPEVAVQATIAKKVVPVKPVVPVVPLSCSIRKSEVPKSDIQMLSLYDSINFDDEDGGVWKQGWNVQYQKNQWSRSNKLKVFIVPHSHNDPGWLKTFENYYKTQTRAIFESMMQKMPQGLGRKFIWAETSYLSLWWNSDASDADKKLFKGFLDNGQIEIVTGGWVMNDEANSHWLSIAQQLTTGHQWLMENLGGYIPKNAWAIDPFGHSSSQPYLLKLAGFENSVIQRVHYRVKKELAQNRQLEFNWRQLWDGVGETDMFTHMMPFYSYDVPHTCGPDPKICCQFDFRRFPGSGMSCPWGHPPRKIINKNVHERSSLILDQWRKKAQLYRSNVVLVPLGDDFRYQMVTEWDNQFQNYEYIIDYINNNDAFNAEVQFGTLNDYFKALHKEMKSKDFPVLSGDFFTYADRDQHYWSGYYTSRPFHKNMDRVLLAYLRAADTLTAQAISTQAVSDVIALQLKHKVAQAREELALFQHHDAITGTARVVVKLDYATRLLSAIKHCQSTMQQASFYLLKQPVLPEKVQEDVYFDVDDIWRQNEEIPTKITMPLDIMSPSRRVVIYNGLGFTRYEVVTLIVASPNVEVYDHQGDVVLAQISPVVSGEQRLGFASNKFQLSFLATVEPLSLASYTVALRDPATINKYTYYTRVRVYNADYWNIQLPEMFAFEQPTSRLNEDISLQAGNSTRVVFTKTGMMKTLHSRDGDVVPLQMEFVQYGSQKTRDSNSGAYLFIPDGPATPLVTDPFPEIVVLEGPIKSTLYTGLSNQKAADIILTVSVVNNPSILHSEVEISNMLLINKAVDDMEVAMRFLTPIDNGDVFYTDVNGMQMIKRRYLDKIPLQANFYPLPAAAYIEDSKMRLTLLTSTPLGMAALKSGQIEVMQDRRLSLDDNRGLGHGVTDNVRVRHMFRIVLENAAPCQDKAPKEHPAGFLTLGSFVSQQTLLQPLLTMQYATDKHSARPQHVGASGVGADVVVIYRSHLTGKTKTGTILKDGLGITLHRVQLDMCYGHNDVINWYRPGDGRIRLSDITKLPNSEIYESTLTFNRLKTQLSNDTVTLCPMEVKSYFIDQKKNK